VIALLKVPLVSKVFALIYHFDHPALRRNVFGLQFENPVGLAAGFDKDGEIIGQCADLGFGFVEVGTVTPLAQEGNPKPRLFRLPQDEAIVNRMGFNNRGVEDMVRRLKKGNRKIIVAGNIGKNKITPNEEAIKDYERCFTMLHECVDFFVVNVSSPNTPRLRDLQDKEPLRKLLIHLKKLNSEMSNEKPILLKIAPDLTDSQLDDIIEIILETGLDGVVATNTTIGRENLITPLERVREIGEGGLSGKPLAKRSTEVIRYLHEKSGGKIPIIGVGGIHSVRDAMEKLDAGASLVEIYTGFIYEGTGLIKGIKDALVGARAGNGK